MTYAIQDSLTMLRRNLRRALRYPVAPASTIGIPLVFLLLFVFVLGDTLGAGLAGGGREDYVEYVTPGILLLAIAGAAQAVAIAVAMDMTEGIIARFRTMAIARVSVLTGHVVGALLQTMIALVLVLGASMLVGFRPSASALDWLALFALLALVTLALIWLAVALGLVSGNVETASNLPMPLLLLPFLGSGFVPTESMPPGLRWFAEYQPFTPIMETVRGLLLGTPIGSSGVQAIAWSVGGGLLAYAWAKRLYNRER
jgi:ABC-2 type transport system permease protein